jgi:hypothetical protein
MSNPSCVAGPERRAGLVAGRSGPTAKYTSIQAAITAAQARTTIQVCPIRFRGNYWCRVKIGRRVYDWLS